jgi:hypothetical protein
LNVRVGDSSRSLWDQVGRVPAEAACFCLVVAVYLVHLFASGYDTFYYDSNEYWEAGKLFNDGTGFSLLSYDYEWRGYSIPLLSHILDSIGGALGLGDVTIVKIFGALLAATLGVVVLPRLAKALFPNAALGWGRVLALNGLLFLYWRDHFDFPLADFPALTAASIGVIFLLRREIWGYALGGLSFGLAANMRGNYWFALVAAVLVAALVPARSWNWRTRGTAVGLMVAGALVASLPQVLMNHRHHDTWSPSIPIAREANLVTTWLGMRAQKYETFVGPSTEYPQSGVAYLDPSTLRLLEEEGITPVIRLGRPSFPSSRRYVRLVLEHPLEMSASYFRHVFNGLDVKYPTPYVRDLDDTSVLLSLLQYTILFIAFARLVVPAARRTLGRIRWSGVVVLLSACIGVIATQAEPRYFLPLTALVYMLVCFGPSTRKSLLGKSTARRVAIGVAYAAFLFGCMTLSSATEDQIEFPESGTRAMARDALEVEPHRRDNR